MSSAFGSSDSAEPTMLVLSAIADFSLSRPPVVGSSVITADCGHQALIAPSGRAHLAKGNVQTICLRCFQGKKMPLGTKMHRVPGSSQELRQALGERYEHTVEALDRILPEVED